MVARLSSWLWSVLLSPRRTGLDTMVGVAIEAVQVRFPMGKTEVDNFPAFAFVFCDVSVGSVTEPSDKLFLPCLPALAAFQ
jgi:hypothetical protein